MRDLIVSKNVKTRVFFGVLAYLILFLWSTGWAFVSPTDEAHPFVVSFDDQPLEFRQNEGEFVIFLEVPDHHYIYKDSIQISFDNPQIQVVLNLPEAQIKFDDFKSQEVEVYKENFAIPAKITLPKDYPDGALLYGRFVYQGCSSRICFRAMKQTLELSFVRAEANSIIQKKSDELVLTKTTEQKSTALKNDSAKMNVFQALSSGDFGKILSQGYGFAFLVTFFAGVITSFMPCVLSIIPLTLSFIGVNKKAKARERIFHLLIFVMGVCVTYSALGILAVLFGQTVGFLYQSRVFLLALASLFFVMGLWMLDVLKFNVPASWQTRINSYQGKGATRYFYVGLTIGLLAAPCVGPLLVPLLVFISQTQKLALGFSLMLSYSVGLSVIFFVVAFTSSAWIGRFAAGSHFFKKILGVLLLVGAAFYVSVLWKSPQADETKQSAFIKDSAVAFELAEQQNKKLVIDFYADWCLPCLEWDKKVFSKPQVQNVLKNDFIALKVDCTEETRECQEMVKRFNVFGFPTIIATDPSGTEIKEKHITGVVMDEQEFIEHLNGLK